MRWLYATQLRLANGPQAHFRCDCAGKQGSPNSPRPFGKEPDDLDKVVAAIDDLKQLAAA